MRIVSLTINDFKSIRSLTIKDIENALIIVGKNSVGKTVILDAIRAVMGQYEIHKSDFNGSNSNIEIETGLEITQADLELMNKNGIVSRYKRFDLWKKDFESKLPSYKDGILHFTFVANSSGKIRYMDGIRKDNRYIPEVLPTLHFISHDRELASLQRDIFLGNRDLKLLSEGACMFDGGRDCSNCFQCIGVLENKKASELSLYEAARLFQYKLTKLDMDAFMERLNSNFVKNGGNSGKLCLKVDDALMHNIIPEVYVENEIQGIAGTISDMGEGLKSMYIFSLLETYIEDDDKIPSIIMIEDPEIYLHPQLQKTAAEILYKLSKKNQIIFSTHSPNMIFNFNSRQICQVYRKEVYTMVRQRTDIDKILDDLGYSANDLMNVSFVFFVEGKQDGSRLPLLLKKYYGETYDGDGRLQRVAIIPTNSCTNIRTYANLKYINKLYIKDQFLMIRDGDGKDADYLKGQLCGYYRSREREDKGNLPRVTEKNVLILKYYSFENYFLMPEVMVRVGVVESVERFYDILYAKYKEYLYKLKSMRQMCEKLGITIRSREDLIANMENIRIYVRGHNLYDIFYGRYKGAKENKILTSYINEAPKEAFKDILEAIDSFVYFDNKKTNRDK